MSGFVVVEPGSARETVWRCLRFVWFSVVWSIITLYTGSWALMSIHARTVLDPLKVFRTVTLRTVLPKMAELDRMLEGK